MSLKSTLYASLIVSNFLRHGDSHDLAATHFFVDIIVKHMCQKYIPRQKHIAEGFDMLGDLLRDAAKWRSKVRAFCFLPPG